MKQALTVLAVLSLLVSAPACPAAGGESSIDSFEEHCDSLAPAEREGCKDMVLKMWGVEVNTAYKDYLARLDARGKAQLRASQVAWIGYRKAEIERIKGIMAQTPGAVPQYLAMDYLINIDRNRARVLQEFRRLTAP